MPTSKHSENIPSWRRQALEIYKKMVQTKLELTFLTEVIDIYAIKAGKNTNNFFTIKSFQQYVERLKLGFEILESSYRSYILNKDKLPLLYKASTSLLQDIFMERDKFLTMLLENLERDCAKIGYDHPFTEQKKIFSTRTNDLDKVFNLLRLTEKNFDEKTILDYIDIILNSYRNNQLKNMKDNVTNLINLADQTEKMAAVFDLLKLGRCLFNTIHSTAFNTWLNDATQKQHKKSIEQYIFAFQQNVGNRKDVQAALNDFYNGNDSYALQKILRQDENLLEFFITHLTTLTSTMHAWNDEYKKLQDENNYNFDSMRLDGIKLELTKGLGKAHGENYAYPVIKEFGSSLISDIDHALHLAIDSMEKRLKKDDKSGTFSLFNLFRPTTKDTRTIAKEWPYFKLLEEYLELKMKIAGHDSDKSFNPIYAKYHAKLAQLERSYFSELREKERLEQKRNRKPNLHI